MRKIAVIGAGYVGLSNALLLSQHNEVRIFDINENKVKLINKKIAPIDEPEIYQMLQRKDISVRALSNRKQTIKNAEFIIIALPTDYNPTTNMFDTSIIEETIDFLNENNREALVIIKSTVPIGFTEKQMQRHDKMTILFSPEFLREGKALYDSLNPSRIIIGGENSSAIRFAELLKQGTAKETAPILFTSTREAEAIKLFSNAYLAMRVAFFNELDTFAELLNLNTGKIIKGVCLDSRIGDYYNNPSFGYGGYCLPKDTKQLLSEYKNIPNALIEAIVASNEIRKRYIANSVIQKKPRCVGIYRLSMKSGSDNYRDSSVLDIIGLLKNTGITTFVYEPMLNKEKFLGATVIRDLRFFKDNSEIIIANRYSSELDDVRKKVISRDLYMRD